ncbi:pyocin knob domain-containing protein [Photorhabdus antumapuensis]|uniref:pyocin knob domain-containing protein n=1 Tax=Photorhabdus antumapuensis TaxID=2862867 RepID=UPI001CECA071|nr:pyocin knob domain-containing protein [Photorhabdus antumapuensis]MCA6221908.1 pyocin knob domain-containing protein [Photorhabdus antumapuensis]
MSTKNDFKPFSINENINVVNQEQYEENQSLQTGFLSDNVSVDFLNKVLCQSSTISSVVANFIATQSGNDILDDGDVVKLTEQLSKALKQKIITEVLNASLTQKGVVQITDVMGDSDILAVTQKLAQEIINSLNENINAGVSNTRKINGKVLSEDITITSQDIFDKQAISVGDNANLNNITTPGVYYQKYHEYAKNGFNYPELLAGSLIVLKAAGVIQRYFVYNSSRIYTRSQFGNNPWTEWAKEYNTLNEPSGKVIGGYTKSEVDRLVNAKGNKNTALKSVNGWWKCGSTGVIYQWGIVNWAAYDTQVNFPIQFPNACVNVLLTLSNKSHLQSSYNVVARQLSVTGFSYWAYQTEISAYWFAIGY